MSRSHCHIRLRRRGAFTLIEMLVVLGIIAVLAAVLFPVVANGRTAGSNKDDLKKIQQLQDAAAFYAIDANETFLSVGSPAQNYAWSPAVNPNVDASGQAWMGWGLRIAPYVRNYNSFLSPLDPAQTTFSGPCSNSQQMAMTNDFSLNWMLGSDGTFGDESDLNDPYAWSPDLSRLFNQPVLTAQIESPANTISFMPSNALSPAMQNIGCLFSTVQASDFSNTISPYTFADDGGGANLAFADGHARFVQDERMTHKYQGQSAPWSIYHLRSKGIWMEPTMPSSTMKYRNNDKSGNELGDL